MSVDGDVFHCYQSGVTPALTLTASDQNGAYSVSVTNTTHQSASDILYEVHIETKTPNRDTVDAIQGDLIIKYELDTESPQNRITDGFIVSAPSPLLAVLSSVISVDEDGTPGPMHILPKTGEPYDASFPLHITTLEWDPANSQFAAPIYLQNPDVPEQIDGTWIVIVKPLRVWIEPAESNFASEAVTPNHIPGFYLYRNDSGQYAPNLDVQLTRGGTASLSDHGIPSHKIIPAHDLNVFIPLNATDDQTPEWTESVIVGLADFQPFRYDEEHSSAQLDIIDNDLRINLDAPIIDGHKSMMVNNDDDNHNFVSDLEDPAGSGEDDLYSLQLTYPQEPGGVVTISGDETVKVWDSNEKNRLLLGNGITSCTIMGEMPNTPTCNIQGQSTVYVEAIAASQDWDAVQLVLADSDAIQRGPGRATTLNTTAPAANNIVGIQFNGADITGKKNSVIVGQEIRLAAITAGPALNNPNNPLQWSNPPGKTFTDYVITGGDRTGTLLHFGPNAFAQPALDYYWADGGSGRELTLTVTSPAVGPITRKTTFDVVRPTAHLSTRGGRVIVNEVTDYLEFSKDPGDAVPGIEINRAAGFQIPQGFTGKTFFVQLADLVSRRKRLVDGRWERLQTTFGLDTSFPYTPSQTRLIDTPGDHLDDTNFSEDQRNDDFYVYLMFTPTGLPGTSRPVPLRKEHWWWSGDAGFNDPWQLHSGSWGFFPDRDTTDHPEWGHNVKDDFQFPNPGYVLE